MRPRFRLRTLLAAVAVVGVICSVPSRLRARRVAFERVAMEHGRKESAWLGRAGGPVIYCSRLTMLLSKRGRMGGPSS
jgi:hypothetical protein